MMNQQPDKFFQEKLAGFNRPAPVHAWDKIEAGINKKKLRNNWLRIAASVTFLSIATALLVSQKDDTAVTIAANDKITIQPKTAEPASKTVQEKDVNGDVGPRVEQQKPEVVAQSKTEDRSQQNDYPKSTNEKPAMHLQGPLHELERKAPQEELHTALIAEEITEGLEQDVLLTVEQNTLINQESITLVYSSTESDVYLDKKALAEATSVDKKPSRLKKLLKKAEDLKINQDPFGDLRQKKNEILALNFKGEKQRGQNK